MFRLYALESKAEKQGQSQELQTITLPLYEHFPFMYITLFTPSIYGTTVGTYPTKHKPGGLSNELKY